MPLTTLRELVTDTGTAGTGGLRYRNPHANTASPACHYVTLRVHLKVSGAPPELLAPGDGSAYRHAMGDPRPGPLEEFLDGHPDVTACRVDGVWHATAYLDRGYGEMHADDEDELLAKLTAALGG